LVEAKPALRRHHAAGDRAHVPPCLPESCKMSVVSAWGTGCRDGSFEDLPRLQWNSLCFR
jgi:hypothetical protein